MADGDQGASILREVLCLATGGGHSAPELVSPEHRAGRVSDA